MKFISILLVDFVQTKISLSIREVSVFKQKKKIFFLFTFELLISAMLVIEILQYDSYFFLLLFLKSENKEIQ